MGVLVSKIKVTKRQVLMSLLAVGLVALAGGAGVLAQWLQKATQDNLKAAETESVRQKVVDTTGLALDGKFNEAHSALSTLLDNPNLSNDDRYTLVMQRGVVYENEKKYTEADEYYKKANDIKQTRDVAECLGRIAEARGDKQAAIDYYKLAKERVADTNPIAEPERGRYDTMIKNLGGTP